MENKGGMMSASISERLATYHVKCRPNIVLKPKDIQEILEEIEGLQNALAYEKAKKNATGFKVYREFASSLKKERGINV